MTHCTSHVYSPPATRTFLWFSSRCDSISTKSAENTAISSAGQSTNPHRRCHPHRIYLHRISSTRLSANCERGKMVALCICFTGGLNAAPFKQGHFCSQEWNRFSKMDGSLAKQDNDKTLPISYNLYTLKA